MKVLYLLTDLWYNTAKLDPCFPFYLLNRMKKMDPVKFGCEPELLLDSDSGFVSQAEVLTVADKLG